MVLGVVHQGCRHAGGYVARPAHTDTKTDAQRHRDRHIRELSHVGEEGGRGGREK